MRSVPVPVPVSLNILKILLDQYINKRNQFISCMNILSGFLNVYTEIPFKFVVRVAITQIT